MYLGQRDAIKQTVIIEVYIGQQSLTIDSSGKKSSAEMASVIKAITHKNNLYSLA